MPLDKEALLAAFRRDSSLLIDAASRDLHAALPSCPDWTMSRLVGHIGAIWASVAIYVARSDGEDIVNSIEDLGLSAPYADWMRAEFAPEQMPPDALDWLRAQRDGILRAFEAADPGKRTWTWYVPDQTAGFWMRRMAHEAAIHRWDAQLPVQEVPDGFDPVFASDGVDEALTIYAPSHCRPKSDLVGNGESFHLHCTDVPGEWVVRFEGDDMIVSREHAKADVAIRGLAADLYLFVWHRLPLVRFDVVGDERLATRYFAFAPAD